MKLTNIVEARGGRGRIPANPHIHRLVEREAAERSQKQGEDAHYQAETGRPSVVNCEKHLSFSFYSLRIAR